jgi:dephospho-CoA kinase
LQQLHSKPYVIIVVPLLSGSPAFQYLVQRILVMDCSETIQVERVVKRSLMNETEVRNIIAHQTPRAERLRLADDLIQNETDMGNLAAQVAALHERYLKGD